MSSKLLGYLTAGALAAALALASPALAGKGGGGMGGGGGGKGGMGGGMGAHAMGGGMASHPMGAMAMHPAGMGAGPHWSGGWHHANFSHFPFHHRFHHRFHRFAFFVGAPYYDYAYYDSCWRRVWTRYGVRVVNVCGVNGY